MTTLNLTDPSNGTTADASLIQSNNAAIKSVVNGQIDHANLNIAGAIVLADLAAAVAQALVPTGSCIPFAGAAAPTGWLICDGSSVLRGDYSALFTAIGVVYGSVDGTHFTLPDLRDNVAVGKSGTKALGATGGEATHTLSAAELAAHAHANTLTDPGHLHAIPNWATNNSQGTNNGYAAGAFFVGSIICNGATSGLTSNQPTNVSINNASVGSGNAHNNLQPYVALNHIIKT